MIKKIKKSPELQVIENAGIINSEKSEKVSQMENLVHNFDIQKIIKTNES